MKKQEQTKGKILVVDDEADMRMMLSRFLSRKGYTVLGASNGKEALSMLEAEEMDAALIDIRMPEMDGFELLKVVRVTHPEIAAIMMTAVEDLEIAAWALKTGAVDYITKPFNLSTILISLYRALGPKHRPEAYSVPRDGGAAP